MTIPCNVLEHISKEPTVSDVIVSVMLITDQIKFCQFQHDIIKVICRRSNDWGVECCAILPQRFGLLSLFGSLHLGNDRTV